MLKLTEKTSTRFRAIAILILFATFVSELRCAEFNCDFNVGGSENELNETPVVKGTEEMICLHFLPYYVKFSFVITVDEFSMLSGKHIFEVFQDEIHDPDDVDTVIQLSGSTRYSQQIPYMRNEDRLVFPVISLLIQTELGKIINIVLEDIKDACQENNVVPEVLPMGLQITEPNKIPLCSQEFCSEEMNKNGLCDLKVFVSWEGTDMRGNTMVSHSKRILNFAKYSLSKMYESMRDLDNNMAKENKNNYNYEIIPEDVRNRLKTKNVAF